MDNKTEKGKLPEGECGQAAKENWEGEREDAKRDEKLDVLEKIYRKLELPEHVKIIKKLKKAGADIEIIKLLIEAASAELKAKN